MLALTVVGIVVWEIVLFSGPPSPPSNVYDYVDYGQVLTEEDEYRQLFSLMDSIPDGFVTLQEFQAYALYRFKTHAASLRDEFGNDDESSIDNRIIQASFLRTLDLNRDGILADDELTPENVKELFDKAKEALRNFDKDGNGLVTWQEFYE